MNAGDRTNAVISERTLAWPATKSFEIDRSAFQVGSSTARVREACEVSLIDQRRFRFMVDEVPNFAQYIMGAMARRIRGMGDAM